jgi:hypothetical protein
MQYRGGYAFAKIVREGRLLLKFVAHSFYGGNAVYPQFLSDLANVYIDGAITYNNFITPYLVKDLISQKHAAWPMGQQIQ